MLTAIRHIYTCCCKRPSSTRASRTQRSADNPTTATTGRIHPESTASLNFLHDQSTTAGLTPSNDVTTTNPYLNSTHTLLLRSNSEGTAADMSPTAKDLRQNIKILKIHTSQNTRRLPINPESNSELNTCVEQLINQEKKFQLLSKEERLSLLDLIPYSNPTPLHPGLKGTLSQKSSIAAPSDDDTVTAFSHDDRDSLPPLRPGHVDTYMDTPVDLWETCPYRKLYESVVLSILNTPKTPTATSLLRAFEIQSMMRYDLSNPTKTRLLDLYVKTINGTKKLDDPQFVTLHLSNDRPIPIIPMTPEDKLIVIIPEDAIVIAKQLIHELTTQSNLTTSTESISPQISQLQNSRLFANPSAMTLIHSIQACSSTPPWMPSEAVSSHKIDTRSESLEWRIIYTDFQLYASNGPEGVNQLKTALRNPYNLEIPAIGNSSNELVELRSAIDTHQLNAAHSKTSKLIVLFMRGILPPHALQKPRFSVAKSMPSLTGTRGSGASPMSCSSPIGSDTASSPERNPLTAQRFHLDTPSSPLVPK